MRAARGCCCGWPVHSISVAKGDLIGRGRTADVFAYGEGRVLKLFAAWMPVDAAQREAELGRKVYETGLPVPAVYEIVEVDGQHGIIYERVDGPTMACVFRSRPWTVYRLAGLLAELQAAVHAQKVTGLPSRREKLAQRIQRADALPAHQRARVIQRLDALPDDNALCHGDFHPENILMSARGPVIIDWIDAAQGHPLADMARTSMLLRMSEGVEPAGRGQKALEGIFRKIAHYRYLRRYLALCPGTRRVDIEAWLPPVMAARLVENVPGEREALLERIAAAL